LKSQLEGDITKWKEKYSKIESSLDMETKGFKHLSKEFLELEDKYKEVTQQKNALQEAKDNAIAALTAKQRELAEVEARLNNEKALIEKRVLDLNKEKEKALETNRDMTGRIRNLENELMGLKN
jgi:predicted  nucleic acid-binding Zn-ribbon protein